MLANIKILRYNAAVPQSEYETTGARASTVESKPDPMQLPIFVCFFSLIRSVQLYLFFTQRQNDGNDGGYCRLRKHECGWVWETSRKQSHVFKNALNFPSYPTTLYFVDCMLTTILHNCCQSHLVSDFTCTYDRSEKLLHPIQTRPNQTCIVCSISFL